LNQKQKEEQLKGDSYKHFINAIRSPATRKGYKNSIRRYLIYLKLHEADDLLLNQQYPRLIESQIIDYIMSLRHSGISFATIQFLVAPIFTFYQLNDIILNRKKVSRYLGEYKRVVKDQAYSIEQIQTALQNADHRMRMIILLLASTGCRVGSLSALTLGNLTKLPNYGLYRIVFYEGTNNEYYTFTTRECASTGIDTYLQYRQRCGEKISFNKNTCRWEPNDIPLIRLQFDVNDILQVRNNTQPLKLNTVRKALDTHLIRSGIRQIEHPVATDINPNSTKRIRKTISLSTGFRKHVISTFIEARLNHEIRELIVDHATQLDQHYFRPSEDQIIAEYLKAEPLLTIDPAARLARENQTLKTERSQEWQELKVEIDNLKALLKR
jgi:integrase